MDALLLIILIAGLLVMLGISIYLLIVFVHPDDKGWGTAWYCKILVVLGLLLVWSQALLLPLDVANNHFYPNSGGLDMYVLWYIVYISSLAMITLLLPYAMLFYETDEERPMCKRLLTALCYLCIALVVVLTLLLVSWVFLKYADIPVTTVILQYDTSTSSGSDANLADWTQVYPVEKMKIESSFVVYSMAMMSFVGWIFLILFGGVGLFALPIDWINAWRNRPKARRSDEMRRTREALIRTLQRLSGDCQTLVTDQEQLVRSGESSDGVMNRLARNRAFETRFSEFRGRYIVFEEEYEIFKLQLEYANSNPIIPWLKLFCGILFLITAILWILQLIFGYLAKKNDRPLIPFLNEMLVYLQNSKAGFFAALIYTYLILYLVWAVIKGNIKFGLRIPFIVRFYPMKPNQTWMNSFIFNIILMLLASAGITQLATCCFPTYTRNTAIYNMFGLQVNFMRFYKYFYQYKVFGIAFVSWSLLVLIYMLFTCNRLPKHAEEIEAIRRGHTHNEEFRNQQAMEMQQPVTNKALTTNGHMQRV